MEARTWVSESELVAALNARSVSPSVLKRFEERYWAGTESKAAPSRGWRLPDSISREEAKPIRLGLTASHLRQLVDARLETGRAADGTERPKHRNLYQARSVLVAVREYLDQHPTQFTPVLGPHGFTLSVAERKWPSSGARDFFEAQVHSALRLFVGFFASDWKDCLCKCRYSKCGRYFMHPKLRESYKNGIFCTPHCAKSAAAIEGNRKARDKGKAILIDMAAQALRSTNAGPDWHRNADLKTRLASKLCQAIATKRLHGYRDYVGVKWVTRNGSKIELRRQKLSPRDRGGRL